MKRTFWRAGLAVMIAAITLAVVFTAAQHPGVAAASQPAASPVAPDHTAVISDAMGYLASSQAADGGFGDMFTTVRVVLATAAVGAPADTLKTVTGTTTVDYLAANAVTYTHNITGDLVPASAGALLAAVVAADADPTAFGGMNIVQELGDNYDPATGIYSSPGYAASPINQLWAIIGLSAAQESVPVTATTYLVDLQRADGGWAWGAAATESDPDTTAFVLQALLASGNLMPWDTVVVDGLQYLADLQDASGGWVLWGSLSADTTAAVVQAYAAAGYTPVTEVLRSSAGNTAHDALVSLQAADGSFGGWAPALSTADALLGLTEVPLPVLGVQGRANRALTWMQSQLLPANAWPGFTGQADVGSTIDAVLAFAAAGYDPSEVRATGTTTSVVDYLAGQASGYAMYGPSEAGKLALVAGAAGLDATNFGGVDLIDLLTNTYYSATLQAFGVPTDTYQQAFPILGLAANDATLPAGVTTTLAGLQQSDGGWKQDLGLDWYGYPQATGPDHTGLAIAALKAGGVATDATAMISATQYLRDTQMQGGGWGSWGTLNTNSTAYAIMGLLAAEEDLTADAWCTGAACPIAALAGLQTPDGPFVYAWAYPGDNGLATWQAVPSLLGVLPASVPTATFTTFTPVFRGYDPDQLFLSDDPAITWGNSIDVSLPFGSDLDRDSTVSVDYRLKGATDWVTGTAVNRGAGVFTATIAVSQDKAYEVSVTVADADNIVAGTSITKEQTFEATMWPYSVFLPLIKK